MPSSQIWTSLVAQMIKNPPAMSEIWGWSLSREVPLEKEMAIHSSIFAWAIPRTEEPRGYSPWGHKELDTTKQLKIFAQICKQMTRGMMNN